MKPIPYICSLLAGLSLFQTGGNKLPNDLQLEKLNGRVKTLTTLMYNKNLTDSAITDDNWSYKTVTDYNKNGNAQSTISQDQRGKENAMTFTYDAAGRKTVTTSSDGHIIGSSTFSTNARGNMVEEVSFANHVGTRIVYNQLGKRDTTYAYSLSGTLSFKMVYHYNQRNQLTDNVSYKMDGSVNYTERFEYDAHDNQLKRTRYNSSGQPESWMSFTYDEHHEQLTERDSADMFIGPPGYMKDTQNPKILHRQFRYSNYDLHDNWQRKDIMYNGRSVQTTLRTLEYY